MTHGISSGEAIAIGGKPFDLFLELISATDIKGLTIEKPALALVSPAASARMAVAESLMNVAAADVCLERVCLSANWMVSFISQAILSYSVYCQACLKAYASPT